MAKLCRSTTISILALGVLILAGAAWAQQRPPIAEQIAEAQGLDSFGQIEAIRYTFDAQLPGVTISRSWVWEPKTGLVSYESKDKDGKPVKVTYYQPQINDQPADVQNKIDPAFYNDEYNLLFPLHVYWDTANVQDLGMGKLPLGQGEARHVVVKYPSEGGYQPGDTWELYVGSDNRVEEFVYRRGGPQAPHLVMAIWTGYKKAGPLVIATERRGTADGKPVQINFRNVSVKLVGSDTWVDAQ